MSCPSTPIEALARSVEGAFTTKYPVYYEDDELSTSLTTALTPNDGAGFRVETISPVKTRDRLEKSLQLHARTGQILSNYRAFLTDYQNDTFEDEEERAERGWTIANDRVYSENNLDSRSIRKDADEVLQRCLFYDEPRLSPSDSSTSTDRAYVGTVASRSNRMRYGLVSLGCVLFVAMLLVGTAITKEEGMKSPPPKSTPGWHEEIAFVLDHEDEGTGASVQKKLRGQLFGNDKTQLRAEPDAQPSAATTGDDTSVSEIEVPSFDSSPAESSVDSSLPNAIEVPSFNSSPAASLVASALSNVENEGFLPKETPVKSNAGNEGSLTKTEPSEETAQVPEFESTDGEGANNSPAPPVPNIEEYASNLIYNAIEAAKYDSALKLHDNVSSDRERRFKDNEPCISLNEPFSFIN